MDFFGTHGAVTWFIPSMNLHVALSVVCGCKVIAINIPNVNLITMYNMSLRYIFHVPFHVTFFTLFLDLQVFLYKPDFDNQNGNVLRPY